MKLVALCSRATRAPAAATRPASPRSRWPRGNRPPADRADRWAAPAAPASRPEPPASRPTARRSGCADRPDPELGALPQRVIDILHRQRRPTRGLPRTPGGISHPQISHQRGDRPAIGGDMVHHRHQHMLILGDTEKPCPQRDLGRQIEACNATAASTASRSRLSGHPLASTTCHPNSARSAGITSCCGIPSGATNSGAQALMAAHHIGQRRPQRLGIQAPTQPQRHRHVVDRGGAQQLVQKPQPGLGKRQRHHRRPLTGHQRLQPTRPRHRCGALTRPPWAPRTPRAPKDAHPNRC